MTKLRTHAPSIRIDSAPLHLGALEALETADAALAFAPSATLEEAHRLEHVTPEWLTTHLEGVVPGARVVSMEVEGEHAGMTSRKRWSLTWNQVGEDARLPGSIFVKATPDVGHLRTTLSVLHMHELESRFYQQIQPELPGLAPRALYARHHPGGRFLLVLEDLVESGCRPYWLGDPCGVPHVRAVTRALAKLHATYWESARLEGDLAWVRPRTRRFGANWLGRQFRRARSKFLSQAPTDLLDPGLVELLKLWNEHADAVFAHWDTKPRTVLHGDTHLGNTFAYPDGRGGLLDWQVMFAGHGLRDFSYFTMTALDDAERVEHERPLFDLYLDSLAELGVTLERDDAWNDHCLFVLDAWDAAMTTFVQGGYGHAASGRERVFRTLKGSLVENDALGRLRWLIANQLA